MMFHFSPVFQPVAQLRFTMPATLLLHVQQKKLEVTEVFFGRQECRQCQKGLAWLGQI